MYSFSYLEPVCCSMSSSNCCFLTCIQTSQEAGQVVWYSHLFHNFPQFIVIHIVKGFGIVNKTEVDVFSGTLLLSWWSKDVGNLISGSSAFSKNSLNIWNFTYCWSLVWRILSITLLACEMSFQSSSIRLSSMMGGYLFSEPPIHTCLESSIYTYTYTYIYIYSFFN